ncbi:hypothetical protein UO65_3466 [Actinokineospora spheciospongiae]|uniref:ESAT-6 protein secretion system EspG family protein n=1 Tax=Actinokineospora spheciospongiae TaxID=909613 RepID=W7IK21_9PSEU|nr:ESX secretion-associated protein EspG [Actinokineospora spheciospongiae]EWC61200.1 hypothetical protein UO65_3466 [Actinokineospora spheciospongiae]
MDSGLNLGIDPDAHWSTDDGPGGAWLEATEVDLLCTFAEVTPPFPLKLTPRGTTAAQRRELFASARARLAGQGLADHRGPRGVAADLVHLLREGVGAFDLLVARRGGALGVLVLAQREEALLVTQDVRGPGGRVHLLALPTREVVDHVPDLVPAHPAALAAPFTLSRRALDAAHRAIQAAAAPPGGGRPRQLGADGLDRLLAEHGIDEQSARRLTTHLQPVLGNGQAGVAFRGGYADTWERSGPELRWLDTARGRFRLGGDPGSDWMSVNPFSGDELVAALRDLAGELWYR